MSHDTLSIYRATDTRNGRAYIGQTRLTLAERKGQHTAQARLGSRSAFHKALRKAPEAFVWEVIDRAATQADLDRLESAHILGHRSLLTDHGYNQRTGGRDGYEVNADVCARISASKTGVARPAYARARQAELSSAMPRKRKLGMRALDYIRRNPTGLTQAELARFFGVDPSLVCRVQNGKSTASRKAIRADVLARLPLSYIEANPDALTHRELADRFNLSTTQVSWIRNKHVTTTTTN